MGPMNDTKKKDVKSQPGWLYKTERSIGWVVVRAAALAAGVIALSMIRDWWIADVEN